MTPHDLLANFEVLAEAPNGIQRLRELVLELAVRGKLVEQDAGDEPASELLKQIRSERTRLAHNGRVRSEKPLPPLDSNATEIPSGWACIRFGSCIELVSGQHLSPGEYHLDPDGLPYLTGPADFGKRTPTASRWTNETRAVAKEGDILVTVKGAGIGKANVLDVEQAAISRQLMAIRPILIDHEFTFLFIRASFVAFQEKQVGIAIPGIGREDILHQPLLLPPLTEQLRIVARVNKLMALLDRLEAKRQEREEARAATRDSALAALRDAPTPEDIETAWLRVQERFQELFATPEDVEPLRETLLQLAVIGRLVPQDPADTSALKAFNEIQECRRQWIKAGKLRAAKPSPPISESEANFSLPDGWVLARLGDVLVDIQPGWSPQCEGRPRIGGEWGVLKVSACSWGRFLPEENKALPSALEVPKDIEVHPGDWIISRANTSELVGRSVLAVDCPPHLLLSDKTLRLTPMPGFSSRWGNLVNLAPSSRAHYASNAGGTSASMRNISQDVIRSLVISIPPVEEQKRIFERFEDLLGLLDRLVANLTSAHDLASAFASAAVHNLEV